MHATPARQHNDIRKFEAIGTHPAAIHNAIAKRWWVSDAIGPSAKPRGCGICGNRWVGQAADQDPRIRIHTRHGPGAESCAIGTLQVVGVPTPKGVVTELWDKWRIMAQHPKV